MLIAPYGLKISQSSLHFFSFIPQFTPHQKTFPQDDPPLDKHMNDRVRPQAILGENPYHMGVRLTDLGLFLGA